VKLVIEFNNKFELEFDVLTEHRIARQWARKVKAAQKLGYPLDDPSRFYAFNDIDEEVNNAISLINKCIDTINTHKHIIDRKLHTIDDQDTLNYLHHIFEVYHGLLDSQTHPYYLSAPTHVQQALADLNIFVHRCETVYRARNPRIVLTWFGLPKKHTYNINDYKLFTNKYEFGTVYINYVEIGKCLLDFYKDDELGVNSHAGDEAFRPFRHFSADVVIRFHNVSDSDAKYEANAAYQYYRKYSDFFDSKGYNIDEPWHAPGYLPVAKLSTALSNQEVLDKIKDNQLITGVYFK
jgi:hypothetical protein